MSKKLASAVLAAAMMVGTSVTAFAYVDPGTAETAAEAATESSTSDTGQEQNAEEKPVIEESSDTAFSTPGNAQLKDDITEDSTKEFLTITTKNNNTFYLVIDRSANTENVYMLSQIDENDLQEFLDSEGTNENEATQPSVVLEETEKQTSETAEETKPEEETKEAKPSQNVAGVLAVLLLAGAGAGAYYYLKIRKKKEQEEEDDSEGLELDDGLETVDERDEEENKKE
ncbi:MAG: DUF4366 domain-containing protein [Ruminococcus sp.]|nr:DUF4366 domain-containing protein [Ruminococcus sp.]